MDEHLKFETSPTFETRDYTTTTTAHTVLSSMLLCRGRSATSCAPQSSSSSRSNILPGAQKVNVYFPLLCQFDFLKISIPSIGRRLLLCSFLWTTSPFDCQDRSHSLKYLPIFTANWLHSWLELIGTNGKVTSFLRSILIGANTSRDVTCTTRWIARVVSQRQHHPDYLPILSPCLFCPMPWKTPRVYSTLSL